MKLNIIKHIPVVLVAVLVYLITGCTDDVIGVPEELKTDRRLVGKSNVEFYHDNPMTGKEYTPLELANLDYDPSEEEFYLPIHQINIDVYTQAKPAKIEVEAEGTSEVLATFNSFTKTAKGYKATWSTNLKELNIAEGGNVKYAFYIEYDDKGQNGFNYASQAKKVFKIHHSAAGAASAIAFYNEILGNTKVLEYTANGLLPNIDTNVGAFLEFDGATNYISLSEKEQNFDFTHDSDFSVSFWINTTDTNSDPSIIGDKDWGSGNNKGFVVAYLGGKWKVNIGDGDNRVDASGENVGDGKWHHISITFDRDGMMKLYQDAVKVAEEDISTINNMDSGLPINIAQDGTGNYGDFFKGKLGGVTISKYVLSEGEIAVQAHKNTGVQFRDGNNVTIVGVDNNGVTPKRKGTELIRTFDEPSFAKLNDANGVLDFRYKDDFSVAFWVKTKADNSDPSMLGDKDWGSGGNKGFVFAFLGNKWKINIGDGEGNRVDITAEKPINDGEWHLLGATLDRDGDMTIYQDGEPLGTMSINQVGDMNSGTPVHIAQDGTGAYGNDFAGEFKNIYFFNKVLSAKEMENLFKE